MIDSKQSTSGEVDFSLALGGPLYQLLLRVGLIRPPTGLLSRRILACILITWLPLAVLTAMAGTFAGGVRVPFILDLANVRFIVALPMLLAAELVVHRRIVTVVAQFTDRGLIAPADGLRFEQIIQAAMRLRNSMAVELLLIILSYTGGHLVWRTFGALPGSTWCSDSREGVVSLTAAGYWLVFVSLPTARFLVLRWFFRLGIWYLFLWRVSRLQLQLNPLHPDHAGGLGFLQESATAFAPALVAQSVFFSAMIGNQVWHLNASVLNFRLEILGFVALLMILVLLPLTFFVYQMVEAKLDATLRFGRFGSQYTSEFRQKWLQKSLPVDEELLGHADIQSLADLSNSFSVVEGMRVVPFDRSLVLSLAILISVPLLPLPLTMVPLDELLERLIKLIL